MNKKLSYNKRIDLYYKDYDKYLLEIIKETIPRQLVSLYNNDLILKQETLKQCIGSIIDVFNFKFDFSDIRSDVEKILRDKYRFIIVNDEPLIMESIK